MAQAIEIQRVDIGPVVLVARIAIQASAPHMTDDDPEGTQRVCDLLPEIREHACFGDGAATFGEVAEHAEVAHLLEHVTVELIARTGRAGRISAGRTRTLSAEEGIYEVELDCFDDVLTSAALASAVWILNWAYTGGGEPEPDITGIIGGLEALLDSLGDNDHNDDSANEDEPLN